MHGSSAIQQRACYGDAKKNEQDVIGDIKARVMLEMHLLPGDPRLQFMTDTRWMLLYKAIVDRDIERTEVLTETCVSVLKHMLGVEFGDELIPLTAFVNPEGFKAVIENMQEEHNIDNKPMTETEVIDNIDKLDKILDGG